MAARQRKKAAAANSVNHTDNGSGSHTSTHSADKSTPLSPHSSTDNLDAANTQQLAATTNTAAATATGTRQPTVSSFINKLYAIVSNPATQHIISWADHGQSFLVKDEYAFSLHIMRQHFRHSNFSSFVRQLNFYGFHKRSTPSAVTQVTHTAHAHTQCVTHSAHGRVFVEWRTRIE